MGHLGGELHGLALVLFVGFHLVFLVALYKIVDFHLLGAVIVRHGGKLVGDHALFHIHIAKQVRIVAHALNGHRVAYLKLLQILVVSHVDIHIIQPQVVIISPQGHIFVLNGAHLTGNGDHLVRVFFAGVGGVVFEVRHYRIHRYSCCRLVKVVVLWPIGDHDDHHDHRQDHPKDNQLLLSFLFLLIFHCLVNSQLHLCVVCHFANPLYFDGLIIQQQKGDLVCCQHNIQAAGDAIIQSTDSTWARADRMIWIQMR